MDDKDALLRRLEGGESGPSVDGDFALAMGIVPKHSIGRGSAYNRFLLGDENGRWSGGNFWTAPSVSSVDAMRALRRELWPEAVVCYSEWPDTAVVLFPWGAKGQQKSQAPTLALALAAAILKAHMQEQPK